MSKLHSLISGLRQLLGASPQGSRLHDLPSGDQVLWMPQHTPEMDRAIQAAKETLPVFWAWHEGREEADECGLKVAFPTFAGGNEYLWLVDIRRIDNGLAGLVASEPEAVRGLKIWQPAAIDPERIVDWTFRKDGRLYGHFTSRVMAAMQPELAAQPEFAELSDTPLPPDLVRH